MHICDSFHLFVPPWFEFRLQNLASRIKLVDCQDWWTYGHYRTTLTIVVKTNIIKIVQDTDTTWQCKSQQQRPNAIFFRPRCGLAFRLSLPALLTPLDGAGLLAKLKDRTRLASAAGLDAELEDRTLLALHSAGLLAVLENRGTPLSNRLRAKLEDRARLASAAGLLVVLENPAALRSGLRAKLEDRTRLASAAGLRSRKSHRASVQLR